jgi:hypothetical protein
MKTLPITKMQQIKTTKALGVVVIAHYCILALA